MKSPWIITPCAFALSGCNDSVAQPAQEDPVMQAIIDAMCAKTKEDLAVALGLVVQTAKDLPEDEQDGIGDLAWDVTKQVCERAERESLTSAR